MTTGEDGEVLREKIARALTVDQARRHYGIDRGPDEAWEALTDYHRNERLAEADAVLALIGTKIEDAYREGWIDGYHNGRGGSGMDHTPDWLDSAARAALSLKARSRMDKLELAERCCFWSC
jgi:hypothetical protein